MSYSQSFADELVDQMKGLGKITTKKMFGALGFYHGTTLFACLFDGDVFYLKAKGTLADELKATGSQSFIYKSKNGRVINMPYWTAPQTCLDDADEMQKWGKKALASLAANTPASATKTKPTKKPAKKK
jgi:DNA transformation protein and related proteins